MEKGVDHIGVTVCFYCYDKKSRLLLQKRNHNVRDENNTWDCGGGSMEFGETFEEAVIREIKEEYCCTPLKLTFCGVNNVLRVHDDVKTHWICLIYAAEVNPKEVKIGELLKVDEIKWFPIDNLPQTLHSMYLTHLEFIKKALPSEF